jgi:hypothetical protein
VAACRDNLLLTGMSAPAKLQSFRTNLSNYSLNFPQRASVLQQPFVLIVNTTRFLSLSYTCIYRSYRATERIRSSHPLAIRVHLKVIRRGHSRQKTRLWLIHILIISITLDRTFRTSTPVVTVTPPLSRAHLFSLLHPETVPDISSRPDTSCSTFEASVDRSRKHGTL